MPAQPGLLSNQGSKVVNSMAFYWTLSRKNYPNRVTLYEYLDFIKLYFIHAIYLPPAHSELTPVYVETWRQQIEGQNALTET